MKDLRDYTYTELAELMEGWGEKPFRAGQVYRWVFHRGARDIDSMTDVSKALRTRLAGEFTIGALAVEDTLTSKDGTVKFLSRLADGAAIESVVIPEGERRTLCVSSQTGCALNCEFCMTGRSGPGRNLTLAELAGQVFAAVDIIGGDVATLGGHGHGGITNVVLMGMGEPLLNYGNVVRFLGVLTDPMGLNFSHNKVTVSTAGVVPAIRRLGRETNVNLAVSLNATTDEVRDRLMPINRTYPIGELVSALRDFPTPGKKHITIEYVLIKDVNDGAGDARRLAGLLSGLDCKVNLIPFNPFPGSSLERPSRQSVDSFHDILLGAGMTVITRASKGVDILAACGQLRGARPPR